jgi:ketosteroid isomerase-like protein
MSKENVEVVRKAWEAVNRGDIDASFKHWAPDSVFDVSRAFGPVHGTYYGLDQIRQAFEEFFGPWESFRIELDELIDAGEDVVASVTGYFRGRDGIEARTRTAFVWTIRDGAIAHVRFYQERQEALEAAGLRK